VIVLSFRIWKKDVSEHKHTWSFGLTTISNEVKILSIVYDEKGFNKVKRGFFKFFRTKKKEEQNQVK